MSLQWREALFITDANITVRSFVFGPCIKIVHTINEGKHPHNVAYYLFNSKRYKDEPSMIHAVDHFVKTHNAENPDHI